MEVEPERNSERDEYRREHHEHARKKTRGVEVGALDTETVVDVDGLLFVTNLNSKTPSKIDITTSRAGKI